MAACLQAPLRMGSLLQVWPSKKSILCFCKSGLNKLNVMLSCARILRVQSELVAGIAWSKHQSTTSIFNPKVTMNLAPARTASSESKEKKRQWKSTCRLSRHGYNDCGPGRSSLLGSQNSPSSSANQSAFGIMIMSWPHAKGVKLSAIWWWLPQVHGFCSSFEEEIHERMIEKQPGTTIGPWFFYQKSGRKCNCSNM